MVNDRSNRTLLSTIQQESREGYEYTSEDAFVEATRDEASARAYYELISNTIQERDQEAMKRIAAEEAQQAAEDAMSDNFEEIEGLKQRINKLNDRIVRLTDEPRALVETDPKRSAWTGKSSILGDGKDPTIRQWIKEIRDKFRDNADHFKDEDALMSYVYRQTEGKAKNHLEPRYRTERANEFADSEEMLTYLSTVMGDPQEARKAKRKYRKMKMTVTDDFHEFFTSFLQNAALGDIPESEWIDDLRQKLSYPLSSAVSAREFDEIQEFAAVLSRIEANLSIARESNPRGVSSADTPAVRSSANRFTDRNNRQVTPVTLSRPSMTPATANTPSPSFRPYRRPEFTPEQKKLASEGRCFNCQQTGHLSRDCTQPRTPAGRIQTVEVEGERVSEVSENDSA